MVHFAVLSFLHCSKNQPYFAGLLVWMIRMLPTVADRLSHHWWLNHVLRAVANTSTGQLLGQRQTYDQAFLYVFC